MTELDSRRPSRGRATSPDQADGDAPGEELGAVLPGIEPVGPTRAVVAAEQRLHVERVHTTPGVHPYDEVRWERRDIVMTNWRDGSINFEQRGVEFPGSWSVNAANIVTTKYFRGAVGQPQREWSLKQLIDRVVERYVRAGKEGEYFASATDAEVFGLELTWMLLNQVFSFNSPVWFNVGTTAPQQVSACFILAVDDTMDAILNWYREEGLIFKGGSGAGLNLSRIRSSKELLSSGGTASGPVSFMRGADASAGTIKSGGATRRAAKMVVLDVDHPDIEEFVETKMREEDKIRALRDAGYDMDLGGRDITSVQYQNANNSVRVDDEFMRAYEDSTDFGLRARMDGRVMETVDARALMRSITTAAWACADPGIQYDGTINDWHTNPETGRITASNPCSEYMSLDNSSCNLASLNLMTFLDDRGSFDAVRFRKSVELIITAMEISICFADFPTEPIGATTRAYRQLGIGYANLGALLMATGHAYDSDSGRAFAATITSLMTGTAYKRSAEIAGVVGPYAGYRRNADAHTRVMRKHAAANDSIRTFGGNDVAILKEATAQWQEGLAIGAENGWRNAQASVLAPTGCLVPGTLVTTDRGLTRLDQLGDVYGERWQDLDAVVSTDEGPQDASTFFINGEEPTRRVSTDGGYVIQGTLTHRVKVVDRVTGGWEWKRLADIAAGDIVPIQLGTLVGEPRRVVLPVLDDAYWTDDARLTVPETVDADLAELVGYFMGDGSLHAKGLRLCVANTDLDVVERLRVLAKGLFTLEPTVTEREGYHEVALTSVRLARWWQAAGFAKSRPHAEHTGKGWTPRVPAAVLETNDREVYASFLRGLFEADGSVSAGVPALSTASASFCDEVQQVLLVLGVPVIVRTTTSGFGGDIRQLRVRNLAWAAVYGETVGFLSHRKAALVSTERVQSGNRDRIHLGEEVWTALVPAGHALRAPVLQAVRRGFGVSRDLAQQVLAATGDERLRRALGYLFEEVAENADGGVQPTYDLSVPANVTYVANGFVSHNTIGFMMDCDTTGIEPDFALVKAKKLVGGGSMQIVNGTVQRALRALGYTEETVEAIVEHIAEHGHVVDAPGLRAEHYSVFDCAIGERSISPIGHVRMMASVQPFISGAISKCVVGGTLLTTADGLIRIDSLHRAEAPDSLRDEVIEVASLGGSAKTDAFYYGGPRPVREVVLRSGHTVAGTPNHRVLVARDGELAWRFLNDLVVGDAVAVQYGADLWSALPAWLGDFVPTPPYGNQKAVTLPSEMSEELSFLLGAYAAEGHITASNHTIVITNAERPVLERVQAAWGSIFGLDARITEQAGKCPGVVVSSKTIVELLHHLGCGTRASDKRIPDAVLRSPRHMVLGYLTGLALDAYTSTSTMVKWAICLDSPGLLDDLQAVLTNLGIVHSRISKYNKEYDKCFDEVYAAGREAQRLVELVPFVEPSKSARAREVTASRLRGTHTSDVVPCVTGAELYAALPLGKPGRHGHGVRSRFGHLLDARTAQVSRASLERVAQVPGVQLPSAARRVLEDGLHFSPVVSVTDLGEREVYDVSVPTTHAFVGNGIVNHNTVNMPASSTIEEVEDIYYQGWKLGLKALAIYRDNCKVGQPLSDAKAVKEVAALADVDPSTLRPSRRRLPKKRRSSTVSFSVAGAEGYLTAGEYDDGAVGEVFIKMSKQGSTLSGVMDAFSVAISIGLQYGVPLEAFVSKYTNMRFDPAGLTDDADVRIASSVMDYLFRRLALDYLPYDKRADLGIFTAAERTGQVQAGYGAPEEAVDVAALAGGIAVAPSAAVEPVVAAEIAVAAPGLELTAQTAVDAPLCFTCGVKMRAAGSCYVCESCGSTSGCS